MARSRTPSRQAWRLLEVLAIPPAQWRHGYELAQLTGLRSGTLYPLLIRLEAQNYLEAQWQPPAAAGRPPRHAYRLTGAGLALVRSRQAALLRDAIPTPPGRTGDEAFS